MESLKYSYRKSALEKEKSYELTKEGVLVTEEGKGSSTVGYETISEVILSYAPTKYAKIYQCKIKTTEGGTFSIKNSHYGGIGDFQDRSDQYVPFIKGIHRILEIQSQTIVFRKGIGPIAYFFSAVVFIVAALVFPVLSLASLFFGNYIAGGIGVIGCIFLFLKMGRYMQKNIPGKYSPSKLPKVLLPTVTQSKLTEEIPTIESTVSS